MGKEAKTPRRREDTLLNVAVCSNLRRTRSFANRGIIYNLNTLILPRVRLGERLPTSSCFFFLLICSAPLGAQLADSRPIYVYSSHGYNAVKSRSNPPIYGRIQTRVSFITRNRARATRSSYLDSRAIATVRGLALLFTSVWFPRAIVQLESRLCSRRAFYRNTRVDGFGRSSPRFPSTAS